MDLHDPSFIGSLIGGAVGGFTAGLGSAVARWLKLDKHLATVARKAADRAIAAHEASCLLHSKVPPHTRGG
jgi:hypothetical protein